jgi:hypothetical protein
MYAFLFTLALFMFWSLVGFATLTLFPARLRIIQGVLVSPAVGVAVTILPVFYLNRLGIPVKDFAGILLPMLGTVSLIILAIKRPVFPFKKLLPFFAMFIVALLLAASPMYLYGFDWLSFSNDDMANYCLAAQRFLNGGYFDYPDLDSFYAGKNYSQTFWFMHVAFGSRAGSELMLAVVWGLTGLNAHQIFMPLIMALHLVLISGTGAMVSSRGYRKNIAIIAMGLLAVSPMTALGALYQLIGQVGGLGLLTAAVTLAYRPFLFKSIRQVASATVPAALVLSAIFIWYPEVLPFFGLGWLVYLGILFHQDRRKAFSVIKIAIVAGLLMLILLNQYVLTAILFMFNQAFSHYALGQAVEVADMSHVLFPYFLIPSGLAALWGLIPISASIKEPFLSLSILVSIILTLWIVFRVLPIQLRKLKPAACVVVVMIVMALFLYYRQHDFGLFKLSMFIQPFLLSVLAFQMRGWMRNRMFIVKGLLVGGMILLNLHSQFTYVSNSTGEFNSGFTEIPKASSLQVNRQFKKLIDDIAVSNQNYILISETSNVVLAKYQALYAKGYSIFFPVKYYFDYIGKADYPNVFIRNDIGGNEFLSRNSKYIDKLQQMYIYSNVKSEIFNSYQRVYRVGEGYFYLDSSPENQLIFIHSAMGNHYYLGDRNRISFYQLENDPMFPGQIFASLGRHFVFQAIHPTVNSRIVMELTDTVVKQFGSTLPTPRVQDETLHFVGRGSGRVFSSPIAPTYLNHIPYIAIDMQRDGKPFAHHASGLMKLYGRDVPQDPRLITAYGRDISLVSEEQYMTLLPPKHINQFPDDLANKSLEYSGIYEDGWISEQSFFILAADSGARFLVIKGMVPLIADPDFTSMISVSLNGKTVAQQKIGLGDFEIKVPVTQLDGRQRIDISFSQYQSLPGKDRRITGGRVKFLGFIAED